MPQGSWIGLFAGQETVPGTGAGGAHVPSAGPAIPKGTCNILCNLLYVLRNMVRNMGVEIISIYIFQ